MIAMWTMWLRNILPKQLPVCNDYGVIAWNNMFNLFCMYVILFVAKLRSSDQVIRLEKPKSQIAHVQDCRSLLLSCLFQANNCTAGWIFRKRPLHSKQTANVVIKLCLLMTLAGPQVRARNSTQLKPIFSCFPQWATCTCVCDILVCYCQSPNLLLRQTTQRRDTVSEPLFTTLLSHHNLWHACLLSHVLRLVPLLALSELRTLRKGVEKLPLHERSPACMHNPLARANGCR